MDFVGETDRRPALVRVVRLKDSWPSHDHAGILLDPSASPHHSAIGATCRRHVAVPPAVRSNGVGRPTNIRSRGSIHRAWAITDTARGGEGRGTRRASLPIGAFFHPGSAGTAGHNRIVLPTEYSRTTWGCSIPTTESSNLANRTSIPSRSAVIREGRPVPDYHFQQQLPLTRLE